MPLADHKPGDVRRIPGPKCGIARLMHILDYEDANELQTWLDNPLYEGTQISEALRNAGHRVSAFTVNRHVRGDCACE